MFGYGSLPAEEAGIACRLHDHRLGWDVAMDNREVVPGYKVYVDPATGERPAVEVAYLSITPAPGATRRRPRLPGDRRGARRARPSASATTTATT